MEIGASKIGDINYLSKILKPFVGVITNIGNSHLETLKNINGVLNVKSEIVSNIKKNGYLIVPNENKKHLSYWKLIRSDINIITFGMARSADFFASDIRNKKDGMHFKVSSKLIDKDIQIKTFLKIIIIIQFELESKAIIHNIPLHVGVVSSNHREYLKGIRKYVSR